MLESLGLELPRMAERIEYSRLAASEPNEKVAMLSNASAGSVGVKSRAGKQRLQYVKRSKDGHKHGDNSNGSTTCCSTTGLDGLDFFSSSVSMWG